MEENTSLAKKEDAQALAKTEEEGTLAFEVAVEMAKNHNKIMEVVEKLFNDIRVEVIEDDEGNKIGQRTHVPPQLIKWLREARMYENDMWKLGGGEIEQEHEKRKLEVKAKLIMTLIGTDPEEREKLMEQWKETVSFKK